MGRGLCHTQLKQYKDAVDDLTKAIDLTEGKDGLLYAFRAEAHRLSGAENLAADDLATAEKLGHKVPKPAKAAVNPAVGTWKMATSFNGMKLAQTITLRADGTFAGTSTVTTRNGTETITDSGTWKFEAGKLTIRGKATGTMVRKATPDGDDMAVEMEEIGKTVTFSREK